MSAYVVLQIEVTDAEKLAQYREIATPIVQKYGGRYLARGGRMDVVEGDSLARIAIVIVEFPSMDAFKQFVMLQNTRRRRPFARAQPEERCSLSKGCKSTFG